MFDLNRVRLAAVVTNIKLRRPEYNGVQSQVDVCDSNPQIIVSSVRHRTYNVVIFIILATGADTTKNSNVKFDSLLEFDQSKSYKIKGHVTDVIGQFQPRGILFIGLGPGVFWVSLRKTISYRIELKMEKR